MAKKNEKQTGLEVDTSIQTKRLAASGLVCDKPCWLYSLVACSFNQATNVYYIRNGFNTSGDIKFEINMIAYTTVPIVFKQPIRFKKGMYIQFVTNGRSITVQYKTDY